MDLGQAVGQAVVVDDQRAIRVRTGGKITYHGGHKRHRGVGDRVDQRAVLVELDPSDVTVGIEGVDGQRQVGAGQSAGVVEDVGETGGGRCEQEVHGYRRGG